MYILLFIYYSLFLNIFHIFFNNKGFFDEASRLYKIAHESIERRIRGGDTVSSAAISIIYKLALCAKRLQNMSEAEQGLLKVLTFLESNLGQDNESVIRMYCELVHILHAQGKMHDAVKYFDRAIMGSLAAINEVNKSTLKKIDVLARVLENKEILKVIIEKLKFIGRSHPMSVHISKNLTTLLSKLDICQEKRIDALFTI